MLLWSADLSAPQRLATPFVLAQAAAVMDLEVEIYFTAQTVHLLTPQAGTTRVGFGPEQRMLSDYLAQTQELGIGLYACGQALHAAGLTRGALVAQCSGIGGSVQFMGRVADPAWRTLVF
jgi:predicted peroxiredoxin